MSRTANARIAGLAFLVYIAAGVSSMAGVVRDPHIGILVGLLSSFCALVLAVTLYAVTADEDRTIAMFGLTCRLAEGVLGAIFIGTRLALTDLTTSNPTPPDAVVFGALKQVLRAAGSWNTVVGATFFAVGSLAFCWLLLRGRSIPPWLAWLGVLASALLVVGLPLQLSGWLRGPVTMMMWLPMAAFEIPGGLWLLVKGVTPRRTLQPRP